MKPISFSIARVNRLRRSAQKTTEALDEQHRGPWPEGWFASSFDANVLIAVFDTLRLKAGFALHAYQVKEGIGGNGIIWAVPADSPRVPPDECSRLDRFLPPPKPPRAVSLMQAIEGDGSPWSHLSASILSREAEEFGAFWHGCRWGVQTILSRHPRQADDPDLSAADWTWHSAASTTWEPTCADLGESRKVVMHVHDPLSGQICRIADSYRLGSYDCTTRTRALASGGPSFVF